MLFPYKYINHSVEKMQEYIDYIFYQVWCKAPGCDYDISLFNGKPDLKELIVDFYHTEPKGADFFIKGIQEIFLIFKDPKPFSLSQLQGWYQSNNDIEDLCHNNPSCVPITYAEINIQHATLGRALKRFFEPLYAKDFLTLRTVAEKIGVIGEHYHQFVTVNKLGKCPFCGLSDIEGEYSKMREAYDHYLPKSKYPFSSINFRNLAPACNKCNSMYKQAKDPLHDRSGNRRKAFYAYNSTSYKLDINLQLNSADIEHLAPHDINIALGPPRLSAEIRTWDELFDIEERFKEKCCSAEAKDWITQVNDFHGKLSPHELLQSILSFAQSYPNTDTNFLKKPFLEACEAQHLFD